jgi:hypothetical protein
MGLLLGTPSSVFVIGLTLLGFGWGADVTEEASSDPVLLGVSSVDPDGGLLMAGLVLGDPLRFVGRFTPFVGLPQFPVFPLIRCFIQSLPLFTTLTATCLVTLFTLFARLSNILEQGCPGEAEGLGLDPLLVTVGLGLETDGLAPLLVTVGLGLVFALETDGLAPLLVTVGLGLVFAIETTGLICGLGFTKTACFLLIEPIFVLIPEPAFGLIFDPVFFFPLQKLLSPFFKH